MSFRLGRKAVYLPKFTIALIRTPHLPANYAQFQVPLDLNKLDMRDYLLHAYGVEVLAVRSSVTYEKLQRFKPGTEGMRAPTYWRPKGIKKMTVELKKPFVWPERPVDLSPWDKKMYDALDKERKKNQEQLGPLRFKKPSPEISVMEKLAEEVLEGEVEKVEAEIEEMREKVAEEIREMVEMNEREGKEIEGEVRK